MKILGVDPGLSKTGWATLEFGPGGQAQIQWGLIRTKQGYHPGRLALIYDRMNQVLAEHQPDAFAVEVPILGRHGDFRASSRLGMAQGVVLVALDRYAAAHAIGRPIAEIYPSTVKKVVAGKGNVKKPVLRAALISRLDLNEDEFDAPEDSADALGVAYCHYLQEFVLP